MPRGSLGIAYVRAASSVTPSSAESVPGSLRCTDGWAIGVCFFFFQAEDGIRYSEVTGVQTCALPISSRRRHRDSEVTGVQTCALPIDRKSTRLNSSHLRISYAVFCLRSEE